MTPGASTRLGQRETHLSECPVCSYCLRGLPAKHRCPECGFRYDGSTVVWQRPRVPRFSMLWIYVVCLALAGWYSVILSTTPGSPRSLVIMAVLLGWVFMAGVAIHPRRCRPFVAATPMGLVMRLRGWQTHTLPWRDIAHLKIDQLGDRRFVQVIPTDAKPFIDLSGLVNSAEAVEALQSRRAMCMQE